MSSTAVSLPVLVAAAGIFPQQDRVEAVYGTRASLRWADLSTPGAVGTAAAGADAVIVSTQRLDRSRLAALDPRVRLISRSGVGLDAIDLVAARELGITVVNQPAYGATEVATTALAMMLHLQRKLLVTDGYVRRGWSGPLDLSPMPALDELTLGIVGCGRIGGELARVARPLVGRVLAHDPFTAVLPPGVERIDDLDVLLTASNLLSVHSPLTPETRSLLGRRELGLLPRGAVVVNVARGGILDEDALAQLLHEGHLAGAGLDVFGTEPLPADSPLHGAPNTVFSPHSAAYSDRSAWRLASWAVEDALAWLAEGRVEHGAVVVEGTR